MSIFGYCFVNESQYQEILHFEAAGFEAQWEKIILVDSPLFYRFLNILNNDSIDHVKFMML